MKKEISSGMAMAGEPERDGELYVWENAPAPAEAGETFIFDGMPVRTKVIDNLPYFRLSDVCKVLEIANARDCKTRLNQKGVVNTDILTPGGMQKATFISEQNLYKVIFQSRKPEAERFTDWVTGEVLPAIRRDGGYIAAAPEETPEQLWARAMKSLHSTVERQKLQIEAQTEQIARLAPDADYTKRVLCADNLCMANAIGAHLGISSIRLNQFLVAEKWIYKQGKTFYPSAAIRDKGYCDFHVVPYAYDADGNVKTYEHLKWTEAGRRAVIELWQKRHQTEAGNAAQSLPR